MSDPVSRPSHYTEYGLNGAELREAIWNLPGPEFSAIQYIYRHRVKGGYESLLKGIQYALWIAEAQYGADITAATSWLESQRGINDRQDV